jgi:hypothetical protein
MDHGTYGSVFWIVVLAIPLAFVWTTRWSRSRRAGSTMMDKPTLDDPRDPP